MSLTKCRDYAYCKVAENSVVGRLTVLNVSGRSSNGSVLWNCICECGNFVDVISSTLNSGLKQSCGCLYNEIKGKQTVTHGKKGSKEYNTWSAMKQRCYYSKSEFYKDYGARGITVCERWLNSFENFLEDMGERPEGMTIDRIDNSLGYYKENCKWSNHSEQGYNRRILKRNISGKTGVGFHKATNKWQAAITINRVTIYLGIFENFETAVRVREEAEIKYYGFTKE